MADDKIFGKTVFLVTVDVQGDDDLKRSVISDFDSDFLPQVFFNLNDAKVWIKGFFDLTICDVPGSITIHPDFIPWDGQSDPDDHFSDFVHGIGDGADRPWLSADDCGGGHVDFFIHQMKLH